MERRLAVRHTAHNGIRPESSTTLDHPASERLLGKPLGEASLLLFIASLIGVPVITVRFEQFEQLDTDG